MRTEGYGDPWEQRRVYSNQLSYNGDVGNGYNWLVEGWPYLIENGDGSITFVRGTTYSLWFDFDPDTGSYTARYGAKSTLTHDADNNTFILAQPSGAQWIFHDFTQSANPPGMFAQRVTPGEQGTEVTSYTGDDRIGEVQRTVTVESTTTVESFLYQYSTMGQLESLTLRRQVNGGGWQNVRRAVYTYYDSGESNGSEGDLRTATREEWNGTSWATVGVSYYRYWLNGQANGFAHGLKFILGEASYARMIDDSLNPLTASNALLALYADNYFEYDASQRVTKEAVRGGSQVFTFTYSPSGNAEAPNNWAVKTVETFPDGSQVTAYTNFIGQVLLKELTSESDHWLEYHKYDADFREILLAEPSAIIDYDDTSPDLDMMLKSGDGLLHVTDYYTGTGGGAAKGYKQAEKVQRGSTGTPVLLRDWEYASHSAGSITVHPISKQTLYRNDDGTGAIETSFSYTWYSGTVQRQQETVTLPAVPAGQNGSGTSATSKMYFDEHGNSAWSMDERGFITRINYDIPTGTMTQRIDDVDTSIETDAPSGWVTPSGGGLNLVSDFEHDEFGRIIQELGPSHTIDLSGVATTIRQATWTVYVDGSDSDQIWIGQGYTTGTSGNYTYTLLNPVSITRRDKNGLVLEETQATRASTAGKLQPTDSFPQSSYAHWTTRQYTECCLLASTRVYHDIPSSGDGSSGTNYDQTDYGYDSMKRGNRSVTPGGTIMFLVYDARSQISETWVGTNDDGATQSDPTGGGVDLDNNMVIVTANEFDGGADGGDGNLTQQTRHVDASTTRVTTYTYDWRDRRVDIDGEIDLFQRSYYDNLDRIVKVEGYDTTSTGNLVARRETKFDNRDRVYQTIRYGVDPSTGTVGNALTGNIWYDAVGNEIKSLPAGSDLFTKSVYDSLGRPTKWYVGYDLDETSYAEAGSVTGDTILEQAEATYDEASNVIQTTTRQRYHDAPPSQTGPLGDPSTAPNARITYTASYPDALGRIVADADYGTNGGTSLSRPSTIPSRSDEVLVSSTDYNSRGEAFKTIDPAGKEDRTEFEDAGRRTKLIENYVDGNPATGSSDEDRTTEWTYTADGQEATITAINSDTGNQTMTYTYGTTLADSDIATSMLKRHETYPDSVGGSDRVAFRYNRQEEVTSLTDQNGSIHSYDYDLLGRQTQDRITTLGTNVDGAVRRIATAYEVRGMVEKLTSHDNAAVGTGNIVNEVRFAYNDFGQIDTDYQAHGGAVNTSTSPKVQYGYADGAANTIRPTGLTYPDGRTMTFGYGTSSGIDDAASRVGSLIDDDGSTHLADYAYLGNSTFVIDDYAQPDVKWTLADLSGSNDRDTDDIYSGLDRFGRIKDCRWYDYGSSADAVRLKYGYNRASSRLWRQDDVARALNKDFDELYAYDALQRLVDIQRGLLNAQHDGLTTKTFAQEWSLDPTENWLGFDQDDDGNGTWNLEQTRSANNVNEITGIAETTGPTWITPTYDPAGNTTILPQPGDPTKSFTGTWDAWNRLVKLVDDDTSDTVAEYQYDAQGRRIVKQLYVSGVLDETRHLYLSSEWQTLEERVDSSTDPDRQFVWGLRYIDDLILRDRDTNSDGTLNERLYALQDAGWNIVALLGTSGTVQERFAYDPYGRSLVLTANFTSTTDAFAWEYRFTGRELDLDTGLKYFRNRYYHNRLGCFISRDQLTYVNGVSLYHAYFIPFGVDPSGMQFVRPPLEPYDPDDPNTPWFRGCHPCANKPWKQKCDPQSGLCSPRYSPPKPPSKPTCNYPGGVVRFGGLHWQKQCVCQCAGDSPGMNCVRGCIRCATDNGAPATVATETFCKNKCNLTPREKDRLDCCLNHDVNNGGCAGTFFLPAPMNPNPHNPRCTSMPTP